MSDPLKSDLYARAGISDIEDFYRHKFVSDEVLDARYFKPLDRFDVRFARTMWVFDNVREGSNVLDLGCGAGMLALLKRKRVTLTGVDLSSECALAARQNGYDEAINTKLSSLPFPDNSFDYVVSLDVLGHVLLKEKDAVLSEIKRVLRPNGVTMHGIECIDRKVQKDYDEMSPDELRRFIEVDGHVGLEEEHEHAQRFEKVFRYVAWEPRHALCLSSEEFLKQADKYGLKFETDFLEYLRDLSFKERRAFDIAMGYVFNKISDFNIRLPRSGLYVLLKASDGPLGPFYNEHRDRSSLTSGNIASELPSLDRNTAVAFDDGWFEPNNLPPIARWMGDRAAVRFHAAGLSAIKLDLISHMPDLRTRPLELSFVLNDDCVSRFSLLRNSWLDLTLPIQPSAGVTEFKLEIRAGRTWQPRPSGDETRDDRELSIAVCNIEIR